MTFALEFDLAKTFARPLIVGASISADWAALSPGKRLSSRISLQSDVRVIARGGQPGSKMLTQVRTETLADRSVVIGFDLFFWDSSKPSVSASLAALEWLITETRNLNLPLIIGDIPELLAGYQPGRAALNQAIRKAGELNSHVAVLPLEKLFLEVTGSGTLTIRGQSYSFLELVPDGLHIGDIAADYLADLIVETLLLKTQPEA